MMDKTKYTIQEACSVLNCKPTTLRSMLRLGYVPRVRRDKHGYRILEPWQVDLLNVLLHMKRSGCSAKQIRRYARLARDGRKTEKERLSILTTRKHQLMNLVEEYMKIIEFIELQEELAEQKRT